MSIHTTSTGKKSAVNKNIKSIDSVLKQHQQKELLRFVVIGSVDDGKSTLIGRLLYETNSVYEDQITAVKIASKQNLPTPPPQEMKLTNKDDKATTFDFSLITDGLKSEREQGITIDVAYRYFNTENRKCIIADTPGHIQYTRNMATGASTAQAAIILIDARKGVLDQTKRHTAISSLLGIPRLIVAINKMDLVAYQEKIFQKIKRDFQKFIQAIQSNKNGMKISFKEVLFIPVSALQGDNIVHTTSNMSWYSNKLYGSTILSHLNSIPVENSDAESQANQDVFLPVQYVLRPDMNFRGYAGELVSGNLSVGNEVLTLPSSKKSKITSILENGVPVKKTTSPMAVVVTLKDEIDISRGDVITSLNNTCHVLHSFKADIVWINEMAFHSRQRHKTFWLKHATLTQSATIKHIESKLNLNTLTYEQNKSDKIELNDIGRAHITLSAPIVCKKYSENKKAGAFILIDKITNLTIACGMIGSYDYDEKEDISVLSENLTPVARAAHFKQKPTLMIFTGMPGSGRIVLAKALEKKLLSEGHLIYILDTTKVLNGNIRAQMEILLSAGFILIIVVNYSTNKEKQHLKEDVKKVKEKCECHSFEIYHTIAEDKATKRAGALARGKINFKFDYLLNLQSLKNHFFVQEKIKMLENKTKRLEAMKHITNTLFEKKCIDYPIHY